jgi:GTP-binding protein
LKLDATFVRSAAIADDFRHDGTPEIALVGRSNVGKSSLINAIVRRRVARTSAAPGKTRLVNIYRVERGASAPLLFVDLPGYGYARGDTSAFEALTRAYFGREGWEGQNGKNVPARPASSANIAALLLIDARHPGLPIDIVAWRWLETMVERRAIVAMKIDKLSRAERPKALRQLESVFEGSVLPVSAVTGEGLKDLWRLIDKLANNSNQKPRLDNSRLNSPQGRGLPEATARATAPRRR